MNLFGVWWNATEHESKLTLLTCTALQGLPISIGLKLSNKLLEQKKGKKQSLMRRFTQVIDGLEPI